MSLLNFNFVMIYILHKMLIVKNHLNYLKDCLLKEHNRLLFFLKIFFFSQYILMESLSLEEENIIEYIINLFRLKKKLNCTAIKYIRNLF